jgi:hypothetical protein
MADFDLRSLPENEIVLHFGGRPNEVDAFTFSNALIAFGEALQEINRQLNPDTKISVSIDGMGAGSFRAKIKTSSKFLGALFKSAAPTITSGVVIGVLTNIVYGMAFPNKENITITDNEVIIQNGADRIIVPRNMHDATQKLTNSRLIEKHVGRAFSAMEEDPSVTDFGILAEITDHLSLAVIPRESFEQIAAARFDEEPGQDGRRYRDHTHTILTIVKAVFQRGNRKWEFVWNSHKISAPIKDEEFFTKLANREILFGQGDELDVTLRAYQTFDDINAVWINEYFEVIKVFDVRRKARQPRLPD